MAGVETQISGVCSPDLAIVSGSSERSADRASIQLVLSGPKHRYGVHNNSLNNLKRGLNERVFYRDNKGTPPRPPVAGMFDTLLAPFEEEVRSVAVPPVALEEVPKHYSGKKHIRYQNALLSLLDQPLCKRDARVSTFVKAEKINFEAKKDPAPRVIQPRDPRFACTFARHILPMEKVIYGALNGLYGNCCVAKGINAFQTGELIHYKWNQFKDPVAISLDASRFDQHVSVDALTWTHKIYKRFHAREGMAEFSRLLDMMYVNKGFASAKDGCIKYTKKGGRMSGDMDTALGNCLLMVAMTFSLAKSLGIRHELIDNGDDCTVIMEREHMAPFLRAVPEFYGNLGFDMKVESICDELERLEFCQTSPVYDGKCWRMVRGLAALRKDTVSLMPHHQFRDWLSSVSQCGLALTYGLPVYQSFYKMLARFGSGRVFEQHSGMAYMAKGLAPQSGMSPITAEARVSFQAAFGIPVDMQEALETYFDQVGCDFNIVENHTNVLTEDLNTDTEWFDVVEFCRGYGKENEAADRGALPGTRPCEW